MECHKLTPKGVFHILILIASLPFLSKGQWAHRYTTGQGNGYPVGSSHYTFDGYFKGDSLVTFGFQDISTLSSFQYEFFQDSYSLANGNFGSSNIIYQRDGSPTSERRSQAYSRYYNGYIVNRNSGRFSGQARYLRNYNGSLLRRDSVYRTLIFTRQLIDTTNSFLCTDTSSILFLINWFSGDTIQSFSPDSIAKNYTGGLDPFKWNVVLCHNDGNYIYLKVVETSKILTYGYDIIKLNTSTGQLEDYKTFNQLDAIFSSSQEFSMILKDSIHETGGNYESFHGIYDSNWQRRLSFSFLAEKFYGSETGSVPMYFSDSLVIFSSNVSDSRVQPNNQVIGSHLRIFDIQKEQWVGSSKFHAANRGSSLIIDRVLGIKNGFIYLNTQTDLSNFTYGILMCLPLDLQYNNPLFFRTLGGNETKTGALELFPNPVNDRLRLNFGSTFTELQFFNMAGSLVGRLPYSEEDTYSTSFLSPGVYSVAIMDGGKVLAERKLMKKLN